ncbi:GDSL-type esterase/lipase family protein [Hymenobacter rubripertinctus]|uniref:GDSL-type esterase/lipase family protein n=1 Tax=Hymenobacter rubripertinctus TaxID=2029981 RepID=UPI0021D00FAB|nr:GDSL-type esterase/lipase family protein [Hymenobacter rubripertinctus]
MAAAAGGRLQRRLCGLATPAPGGGAPPNPDFDQDHEGHWGWRADQLLAQMPGWAQTQRPDIVLLHVGSNDIFQDQSATSTRDEVGQLIDVLRAANPAVKVVVAQVIPNAQAGATANLSVYNSLLPGLVAQKNTRQSPVVLVDQFTGFVPATDSYDGTHPNAAGEAKMAANWYAALRPLLAAPLPVSLTRFMATAVAAGVRLDWHTATEVRNAGFQPERSTDGRQFGPLGFVPGQGSTASGATYSYLDTLYRPAGVAYYRLQQLDTDGTRTFSGVVRVGPGPGRPLTLYPVPATDWLMLEGIPGQQRTLQVYDLQGRQRILPLLAPGQRLDIRQLPAGVYHIRSATAWGRFVKR